MNLWERIKARFTTDPKPAESRVVHLGRTQAGIFVTPDTALRNATVWACVTYLGRTVGQLPWHVMVGEGDAARRASRHPVAYLLHTRPSPEMGALTWRETMVGWAALWGNAVAEIQRDNRGVPIAMWPIHPSRVSFERDRETGALYYRIWNEGAPQVDLQADDVFHLRGFGDGPIGLNVIAYAAQSIGWAQATELFGASFFGEGMNPTGVLQAKGRLDQQGIEKIRADIRKTYTGRGENARTIVLDAEMSYTPISRTPDEAQFIETRQHQVEEICRWFGVPPHKVMHLLRATFSNIEHQSIEVVVDSLTPWVLRLEQEADYKLFGARSSHFTKLDLKGLMRGDFKSRQEGLQIMRRNGVISANEWRALEDMNPISGDGDKYIVEGNMTTLEKVGEEAPEPAPVVEPARGPARQNGKAH